MYLVVTGLVTQPCVMLLAVIRVETLVLVSVVLGQACGNVMTGFLIIAENPWMSHRTACWGNSELRRNIKSLLAQLQRLHDCI